MPEVLSNEQATAIATAGLASWVARSRREPLQKGSTVLVTGATGATGAIALSIARHFGASKVIASAATRSSSPASTPM